jgi:hypothetical protein
MARNALLGIPKVVGSLKTALVTGFLEDDSSTDAGTPDAGLGVRDWPGQGMGFGGDRENPLSSLHGVMMGVKFGAVVGDEPLRSETERTESGLAVELPLEDPNVTLDGDCGRPLSLLYGVLSGTNLLGAVGRDTWGTARESNPERPVYLSGIGGTGGAEASRVTTTSLSVFLFRRLNMDAVSSLGEGG